MDPGPTCRDHSDGRQCLNHRGRSAGRLAGTARFWIGAVLTICLARVWGATAQADVVWREGADEPLYGRVVRVDDQNLVFDARRGDSGEYDRKVFPLKSIVDWVVTVDVARLEQLDPDQPGDYRDYAEELVVAKIDPEAQALAVRLLAIAAYQADQSGNRELRNSAIRNLAAAARSDWERELVERLGQVYGLSLRPQSDEPMDPDASAEAIELLVRAVRRERWAEAARLLTRRDLSKSWEAAQWPLEWGELKRMVDDRAIPPAALESLLWIELAIEGDPPAIESTVLPWAVQSTRDDSRDRLVPSLRHWNGIDPRRSVYRNGQWQMPGRD